MANENSLKLLRASVEGWNRHREEASLNRDSLDLKGANLHRAQLINANLSRADLHEADLHYANLNGADLSGADLGRANLRGANLSRAILSGANLIGADLRRAYFAEASLSGADLSGADLRQAKLQRAFLTGTNVSGANFEGAFFGYTCLTELDLSAALHLDSIEHGGPSSIGIDTVFKSHGHLDHLFLRGCGVPETFIEYAASLTTRAIEYYSCFISYSTKDQAFAERLHNDLQAKGVRCWFAPHDMQAGKKIHEQIDEAIRLYDKLLLILSSHSMASDWVHTEIAKARQREVAQQRKMLFPVRLVDVTTLQNWECFDADRGKDSAREIREYYIPDFSRWDVSGDGYRREFEKLLRDLRS